MRSIPWILLSLLAIFFAVFVQNVEEHRYGKAGHKFERDIYSGQIKFSPTGLSGVIYHPSEKPITSKEIQVSVTDEYQYKIEGDLAVYSSSLIPDNPKLSYTSFAFSPKTKGPHGTWSHTGLYNFSIKLTSEKDPLVSASSYWEKFSSYRVVSPIFLGWK